MIDPTQTARDNAKGVVRVYEQGVNILFIRSHQILCVPV